MSAEIQKRLKAKIRAVHGKDYGVSGNEMRKALYDVFVYKYGADAVGPFDLYVRQSWTDEGLIADAKRYTTRSDWCEGSGGYKAARKRGKEFFELCCAHMTVERHRWSDDELIADAKRFSTRTEWFGTSCSAYITARNRGNDFFELCCAHMDNIKNAAWSDEEILKDAKRFATRVAWQKGSYGYQAARKRSSAFFEQCCAHMEPVCTTWTDELLLKDAKQYTTRGGWNAGSSGYQSARKRGKDFFELCCAHMVQQKPGKRVKA